MNKLFASLVALGFTLFAAPAFAADPLTLPDGAPAEMKMHNQEGIKHFNKGHYQEAFKHFHEASDIDHTWGETHFNEALALHRQDKHGDATMHFKAAKKFAKGNSKILDSQVLLDHVSP